jgi:molybdenum cofactor synthesis domain-containing protein
MAEKFRTVVITLSDKASRGERQDQSGETVQMLLMKNNFQVIRRQLLADNRHLLSQALKDICDGSQADLVLTTGGTGFSPTDITPEATLDVAERLAPGLAELMRYEGLKITPRAMLSRGVAAIRGKTLIINLPGSPKGASENLTALLPILGHALEVLSGNGGDCALPISN